MRRRYTKAIARITLAILVTAAALISPVAVYAADPPSPDIFTIDSVLVVRHLIEDDDFLLVFAENIHYDADQPSTPANKLFHFRLMDTDGETQLGAADPYPYNNSGYDMGFSAFYFPAADAPTWETALILKVMGNPQYWDSPPEANYTLVTSDYSQLESQDENQDLLRNFIVEVCRDLEVNWSIKLLTETSEGTILNSTGDSYARGTILGLQAMAPQLFSVQTYAPDTSKRGWSEIIEPGSMWEGTIVEDALVGLGEVFNNPWIVITGIIVCIIVILLFAWAQIKYSDTRPAMIASVYVISGAWVMEFIHPVFLAIYVLIYGVFITYVLWWARS